MKSAQENSGTIYIRIAPGTRVGFQTETQKGFFGEVQSLTADGLFVVSEDDGELKGILWENGVEIYPSPEDIRTDDYKLSPGELISAHVRSGSPLQVRVVDMCRAGLFVELLQDDLLENLSEGDVVGIKWEDVILVGLLPARVA